MWRKSKRVLVSSVLSLSLVGNTTVFATVNDSTKTQENENIARNYLKVNYEGKVLFHEQVPSKTMIQVLDENNEVVDSTVLSGDKEMNLEKPKVSNGKMLSYWTIEIKDEKLLIKPVLTTKEEFSVKFYVKDVGGNLLENHQQIKEVVKSATKDTKLKDVLPEVNPNENYKFAGWFETVDKGDGKKVEEKLQNIDDRKVTDSKGEYYAKFFSDFNNNGIDDKTEEITVNFVTNTEEQIEPVKLKVGQKVTAPKLSNKDKVFAGWYTNAELTNKFSNDSLKESTTLYAKWEKKESENVALNYLKVSYENKVLYHEQVPSKTMIRVLDENNEVVDSTVLSGDKEMNLEKPKISNGKILSYWSIGMKDGKLLIKPVLANKEEFSVKFYVKDVGGNLLENHQQIKEVVKSAAKDTKLKDVLPEISPNKNYKFAGWFETVDKGDGKKVEEKLQNIDDKKITDSKGEYYAKFFSDFNNNGIDDKTEEITVNFVTNIEEQIEPVKLNVGQKIKAPKLSNKDKIFIGWYTNAELTNKFSDDNLKDSITLYAKWEDAEKVITESEKKPITDKDVSDQVEKILNERLKELKEGQTNTEKPNETTTGSSNKGTETTAGVTAGTTEKPKDTNNESKGATTNNTNDNTKSNNSNTTPPTSNPWGGSIQNDTRVKDNVTTKNPNNSNNLNSNKVSVYTETKYVFKNKNVGEKYMVKFLDESGAFVSSLTLPYGKTIKILDENETPREEYAVRQDTTINLDTERYVNKGSTFIGLDTRSVQVNSAEITEVFPTTAKNSSNSFLYKKDEKASQKEESNTPKIIAVLVTVAAISIILGIFLLARNRKKKKQNPDQNINM